MPHHRVLVVVGPDGAVSGGLGSATRVVIADADRSDVAEWSCHDVHWGDDQPPTRQAGHIVTFVRRQRIEAVVAGSVTGHLRRRLAACGVAVFERDGISMRAAAVAAAMVLDLMGNTARPGAAEGGD